MRVAAARVEDGEPQLYDRIPFRTGLDLAKRGVLGLDGPRRRRRAVAVCYACGSGGVPGAGCGLGAGSGLGTGSGISGALSGSDGCGASGCGAGLSGAGWSVSLMSPPRLGTRSYPVECGWNRAAASRAPATRS